MGIQGFFVVLAVLLGVGCVGALVLALRHDGRRAILVVASTLLLSGVWYTLPMVDVAANALFFPDDTVYADGFSDRAFRQVAVGNSGAEVLALLGEPLDRRVSTSEAKGYWYYSRHGPRYGNYWNQVVVFDEQFSRVVGRIDEFYSD